MKGWFTMKQGLTLLVFLAVLTLAFVVAGCGAQDSTAQPSTDTAAIFTGSFLGKAVKGTTFELVIAAKISGGTVNVAVAGPNTSGLFPATGACSALGAISFSISALNDGVPVSYSFKGTMERGARGVTGSGTWTSPTRWRGTWSISALTGATNSGSWTLTKPHLLNRKFAWNSAYAALVDVGGQTVLAILFDRAGTAWPFDAIVTVKAPQNAVVGTAYSLSDLTLRWSNAANEHYYAKERAPRKVTFSLKQLNTGGKLGGKLTATLVPFGSASSAVGWQVTNQPFANVVIVRDWR